MPDKLYVKIGELAKRFNVNPSHIRYWEQEFDFIRPKKNEKGTRYYSKKDVDRFEIVHHLVKEKGMTIQGARDFLKNKEREQSLNKLDVINTLKRTRQLLVDVRDIMDSRNPDGKKISE